jgi:aminoglycoside phosphotransferase (APT) family kinase protein
MPGLLPVSFARMNDHRLRGYLAVLAADGHQIAAGTAELRSGQFHDVVLAGDVAYRFPRDAESRRALPQRVALLTALAAARLPVAIPAPVCAQRELASERMHRPVGSCYAALSRVPGCLADLAIRDVPGVSARLARQLADLLDQLARLGSEPAIRQAVPAAQASEWRDWAGQVRDVLFPLMSQAGRDRAEAELTAVQAVAATGDALVHTDLGGANLLLTASSESGADESAATSEPAVTGILDWDGARIGNQANDLASLAVTFGWPLAAQIDRLRQSANGPLISSARVIAATFALQQALPAALSGDTASLDDGLMTYR